MCVMSAVTDHYQREWGNPWITIRDINIEPVTEPLQGEHVVHFKPSVTITAEQWEEYQRLERAAAEIDEKTNQPDCIKPDLAEWEVQMEAYLIKKGVLNKDGLVPGMIYNK